MSAALGDLAVAAVPGHRRLAVVLLRGGMDGLHMLRPFGDPAFRMVRPGLSQIIPGEDRIEVNGLYGLCLPQGADELKGLWSRGELSFIQAVSTPYRHGRSHFEGQDMLESGGAAVRDLRTGWLSRMMGILPGVDPREALTLSSTAMLLGKGTPSLANWSAPPDGLDAVSPDRLLALYEQAPAFRAVATEALRLSEHATEARQGEKPEIRIARAAADMLRANARIAAFSIGGWDTHSGQSGRMQPPLKVLSGALAGLREGLGPLWAQTAVICVTEFGRSARENGSGGTDHGTGGMALLAGGAIRGGQVHGDWPGLGDGNLFEGRDLNPTADVRLYLAALFRDMFGAAPADMARNVFPGVDVGQRLSLLA